MNYSFWHQGKEYKLSLREESENFLHISLGRKEYDVHVEFISSDELLVKINGKIYDVIVSSNKNAYDVRVNGKCIHIGRRSALHLLGERSSQLQRREVKTSMPGRIIKILAGDDDAVEEGQAVLILEAMKMQNEIKSPQKGRIVRIGPKPGELVEAGTLLFIVE